MVYITKVVNLHDTHFHLFFYINPQTLRRNTLHGPLRYLLGLVSLFLSSEKPQIFFLVKKKVIGSSVIVLIVGIWLALCVECTWRWIRACYYNKFTCTISVYYSLLWHEMVVEDETVVEEYDPHERDVWFYSTRGPKLSINWSWLASSCFSLFTYLFRRMVVVVCVFS